MIEQFLFYHIEFSIDHLFELGLNVEQFNLTHG